MINDEWIFIYYAKVIELLAEENRNNRRKACPRASLPTMNVASNEQGSNLSLLWKRPACNRLNHDTAVQGLCTQLNREYNKRGTGANICCYYLLRSEIVVYNLQCVKNYFSSFTSSCVNNIKHLMTFVALPDYCLKLS